MNKTLLFHSFDGTKNADPFYDISITQYKNLLLSIKSILPSEDIVISFDDGYKSIIPAVDLANKLNFKTNVNIVTSKINHDNFLSKKEIQYLYDQSTNIGSHSHNHSDLTQLSTDLLEKELIKSKNYLEEILGVPIEYLSLPYGGYTKKTILIASKFYKKIAISKPLLFDRKLLVGRLPIHNANIMKYKFISSVLSGEKNINYQAKCIIIQLIKNLFPNDSYRKIKKRFSGLNTKNYF